MSIISKEIAFYAGDSKKRGKVLDKYRISESSGDAYLVIEYSSGQCKCVRPLDIVTVNDIPKDPK